MMGKQIRKNDMISDDVRWRVYKLGIWYNFDFPLPKRLDKLGGT